MIEPVPPEAYLAIASFAQTGITKYKDHRRAKKSFKLAHIASAKSSNESSLLSSTTSLSLDDLLSQEGLELNEAGYIQFCPDSPVHPRAWSKARKMYDLILIMCLNAVMSAMSNAGTPLAGYAMDAFAVSRAVGLLGFTTIYLIGLALGHLLLSPYADRLGRKTLYVASAFLFSAFCIPVAATPHIAAVFVGRFVTGLVSAVPRMIVISSIEDFFDEGSEWGRSWALWASSLTQNIGLVIGPIVASQVAGALNWRWPFYISTIILCFLCLLLLLTTHESSRTAILHNKVTLLHSHHPKITHHASPPPLPPSSYRPLILLFASPLLLLLTLISSLTFTLLYILPLPLPQIYTPTLSPLISTSLLSLLIPGLLLTFLPRYRDHLNSIPNSNSSPHTSQTPTRHPTPLTITIAALTLPLSLWWFAWTIPPFTTPTTTSYIVSALSFIVLGYAIGEITFTLPQSLQNSSHAAGDDVKRSVRTATSFLQALFAGGGVLLAEVLYKDLSNNIATSVLAAIATVMALLLLILVYGTGRSTKGEGGDEAKGKGFMEEHQKRKERKEGRGRGRKRGYEGGDGEGGFEVEMEGGWTPYIYACVF